LLIEAQQADLELYNYVREEIYPSFQREYGSSLDEDVASYQKNRINNYNNRNLTLSRLKHFILYKPLLHLNRWGLKII
jgi:hypothetical protein